MRALVFRAIYDLLNLNKVMSEIIQDYYNNITEIYIEKYRKPEDKSKAFRTVLEKFLKKYLNIDTTLDVLLCEFNNSHQNAIFKVISHNLRKILNKITHGDYFPNEDEVKSYFQELIMIVFSATNIQPSNNVIELLAIDQDKFLNELNDKQKLAVIEDKRIVYVNAGPGTGKTDLIISKIYYHIRKSNNIENIVALSYTNSAANQLESRLSEKVFYSDFKKYNIFSGTIHSFALNSLKDFSKHINTDRYDFSMLDEEEIEFFAEEIGLIIGSKYSKHEIILILQDNISSAIFDQDLIEKVEAVKEKYNLICLKDILLNFQKAIISNDDFNEWLKNKISFLLVDEAQDLNKLEYDILELLLNKTNMKLFLVGDPRQNIFSFNGGSYEHLNSFLKRNDSEFSEMVLDTSYRCSNEILKIANKFEFSDCENFPILSSINEGEVEIMEFEHKADEALELVNLIKKQKKYKDIAILITKLNYLDLIAEQLNEQNIPFITVGGKKYLKQYIRLFFHLFRLIVDNKNSYSLKFSIKHLDIKFDKFLNEIDPTLLNETLLNDLNGIILSELIFDAELKQKKTEHIINIIWNKLSKTIFTNYKEYENSEIEKDIKELINIAQSYSTIDDFINAFTLNKEIFKSFYKKDLEIECINKTSKDAVTLSTIHSAKGLVWKNVIIPGLSDGIFPNPYYCEVLENPEKTQDNYNDELKKLYVEITRSSKKLILTYPLGYDNQYGRTFYVNKSRFLKKIGL